MSLLCIGLLWIACALLLTRELKQLLSSTADTKANLVRLQNVLTLIRVQHWRAWRQGQAPWWIILEVKRGAPLPEIEHAYERRRHEWRAVENNDGGRRLLSVALLEARRHHARLLREDARRRRVRHQRRS